MKNFDIIGINFRTYLKFKGLGVNQAAKKLDFSGSQVSNICNGKNFGSDKLFKIINVFNDLNIEWLITGTGKMLKNKEEFQKVKEPIENYEKPNHTEMFIDYLKKENANKDQLINELKNELISCKKNQKPSSYIPYDAENEK